MVTEEEGVNVRMEDSCIEPEDHLSPMSMNMIVGEIVDSAWQAISEKTVELINTNKKPSGEQLKVVKKKSEVKVVSVSRLRAAFCTTSICDKTLQSEKSKLVCNLLFVW